MEPDKPRPMTLLTRLTCVLSSAALLAVAMPPYTVWPLALVALVPLHAAARGLDFPWSCRTGFLWGMAVAAATTPWFWHIFHGAAIALWMLLGAFWGLSLGLSRQLSGARELAARPVLAATLIATCWTGVEYFRAEIWPLKFALSSLGSTQVAGPFLPVMAVVGLSGVTFLVALVNALFALSLERAERRPAAVAAVIAVVALAAAQVRPSLTDRGAVNVVLLQVESSTLQEMRFLSAKCSPATNLLVWPEYCSFGFPLEESALGQAFEQVARERHATFLFGAKEHVPGGWHDTIFALDERAQPLGRFHKAVPIPLFDDGLPGKSYAPIQTPQGPLGVMVCYDSDFCTISRRIVAEGAELLVVPTLDLRSWGWRQHQQRVPLCQARAVENGRFLVRAASSGVSVIVAPDGTVMQRLDHGTGLVQGAVRRLTGDTLYVRGGWLLAPLSLCLTFLVMLWLAARSLRRN